VAVIFAGSLPAALAAKSATTTIPIVLRIGADLVKLGVVANLSYKSNLVLDFHLKLSYKIASLAHRGASPEAILKAERGVASCGGGS
jgi:hypothetical protein